SAGTGPFTVVAVEGVVTVATHRGSRGAGPAGLVAPARAARGGAAEVGREPGLATPQRGSSACRNSPERSPIPRTPGPQAPDYFFSAGGSIRINVHCCVRSLPKCTSMVVSALVRLAKPAS